MGEQTPGRQKQGETSLGGAFVGLVRKWSRAVNALSFAGLFVEAHLLVTFFWVVVGTALIGNLPGDEETQKTAQYGAADDDDANVQVGYHATEGAPIGGRRQGKDKVEHLKRQRQSKGVESMKFSTHGRLNFLGYTGKGGLLNSLEETPHDSRLRCLILANLFMSAHLLPIEVTCRRRKSEIKHLP